MAQYANIVKVAAPAKAAAGETVIVDVSVKNTGAVDRYIAVTGVYNSSALSFQLDYLLVSPGQTVIMRGWFTMPSKAVTVWVYSWYWDGSNWVYDDGESVSIALAELVAAFSDFRITDYIKV